ncbi:MAG TPA: hemolysin III family protein [Spirochaetia bacterium]|nr:hemolysin III family protein [Spirochaetia bacterium]
MIGSMSDSTHTESAPSPGFLDRLPLSALSSVNEERANTLTHAAASVGAAAAVAALIRLVVDDGVRHGLLGIAVFGFTLLNLYLVSTLYHHMGRTRIKRLFRLLDHLSILYLIAGSYTVVALLFIEGPMRHVIIGWEWGLALVGTLYKLFYLGRVRGLSIVLYLLMGWFAVFAWRQVVAVQSGELGLWLLAGGIAYTAGLTFFGMKRLRYHHAIWHLFVMAGSVCHIIGIYRVTVALYG